MTRIHSTIVAAALACAAAGPAFGQTNASDKPTWWEIGRAHV